MISKIHQISHKNHKSNLTKINQVYFKKSQKRPIIKNNSMILLRSKTMIVSTPVDDDLI